MIADFGMRILIRRKRTMEKVWFGSDNGMNFQSPVRDPKSAILMSVLLFALCAAADAQQASVQRIGYISSAGNPVNPDPAFEVFRKKMRELGYIEGKNIVIEHRYAGGRLDRMPSLVEELIAQKIDAFVAINNVVIRAAMKATKSIPIIMRSSIDPVAAGYVKSLAEPGGNVTGMSILSRELSAKRVELLKEVVPGMLRLAILWDSAGPGPKVAFKEYEAAAKNLKVALQSLEVQASIPDFETLLRSAKKARNDGLIVVANPLISQYRKRVFELGAIHRLPSLTETRTYVSAGALMSYATSWVEVQERLAIYVDKILKGAKPTDLPIEQPTKFELVINLKTAKQIGLTIPPHVLARANEIIR